MPVYGVSSMQTALWQTSKNNEGADFSGVFQNVLKNELASSIGGEQWTASDPLKSVLLTGALGGSFSSNALLMAEFIKLGAFVPSMMSSISTALDQSALAGMLLNNSDVNAPDGEQGVIPDQPWKPVYPSITSTVFNRSPQLYNQVIRQFSVETHQRYAVNKKGTGDTYCNIFVWDVTRAMGAEIPHYYNAKTGVPMEHGDKGANRMNANAMYNWLHEFGGQYGWFKVDAEQAQLLANQGRPVVTALKNSGGHGHVQVVCPSEDGRYDEKRGVTIAQAGRNLTSYTNITRIYNKSLPNVAYFAHL